MMVEKMIRFNKKILLIGFGSVAQCTLPILLRYLDVPLENITVVDFEDKKKILAPWLKKGVKYSREKITQENMARVLARHTEPGGLIIDLAWNIDCIDIVRWCFENKVLYVNTSVEEWDPYKDIDKKTPFERSLYYRHMLIRKFIAKWKNATTAVVDHGANPGLISHFTKQGLIDIGKKMLRDKEVAAAVKKKLEKLIADRNFAELAMTEGVKVIHVSERDTQITNRPKEVDEFVGTWSIEGLREEGISPAEMGWGTHEVKLQPYTHLPPSGPKNQVFLSQMGMNTWVHTWIPHQEIVGMVIRHGEAFTISDRLTVWKDGKAIYRPTVHYAYMPCHETLSSLHELRCRNYDPQPKYRIMQDEITTGADILGSLLMGHKYNSWWTGSDLSIEEARELVPHQNATTMQVAIGITSAILWMIKNPQKGFCVPDDLPHDFVLKVAKPYLGKFISEASDWTPFKNHKIFFKTNPNEFLDAKNPWCFQNFLFRD
jgi:homospermidine synthase